MRKATPSTHTAPSPSLQSVTAYINSLPKKPPTIHFLRQREVELESWLSSCGRGLEFGSQHPYYVAHKLHRTPIPRESDVPAHTCAHTRKKKKKLKYDFKKDRSGGGSRPLSLKFLRSLDLRNIGKYTGTVQFFSL